MTRRRITLEEAEAMLGELVDELPRPFFEGLNGGVILSPEAKLHPVSGKVPLYIMGEYHRDHGMGRSIIIYYGSFDEVHGHRDPDAYKQALRRVLRHEFRHHVEARAGSRDLIKEDEDSIAEYRSTYGDDVTTSDQDGGTTDTSDSP